jgi:hypothetical protein
MRGMPRVPFNLGVPFAEWMRHLLDLYKIDLTSDQKRADNKTNQP